MASKVQIANLALAILGEPPIIALTDEVKGARVMNLLFDTCRDAVLRMHPWNFATRRTLLAERVEKPPFGFAKIFALPSDFLRLIRLNDGRDPYRIEADGLLSDTDLAQLRYIARIEDTARYDPMFVQTLAAYLAAHGAMPITSSQSIRDGAREQFFAELTEARSVDGMENFPEVFITDYLLEAWFAGGEQFRPIADPDT
jgi:hypothetical protein